MPETLNSATRNHIAKIKPKLIEAVNKDIVLSTGWSQLGVIAGELCQSVCEAAALRNDERIHHDALVDEFVDDNATRIRSLLTAIPPAFHHVTLKTTGGDSMLFDLSASELQDAAATVIDVDSKKVLKAYGTVWAHARALSELRPEAKSQSRQELLLNVNKDGVEYVAQLYLDADNLVSPLLEWAIVDALVFYRVMEFASACAFTNNLPGTAVGQVLEGPLLPGIGSTPMGSESPNWLSFLGGSAVKGLGKLTLELIVLAATWAVADWITSGEATAKWTVFTGVTAARWVRGAIARPAADAKGATNLQMLWDMGIVHERVPAMNVGLLQHLLYRLEERGAAFSPAVYSILDRRGRQEASSPTAHG